MTHDFAQASRGHCLILCRCYTSMMTIEDEPFRAPNEALSFTNVDYRKDTNYIFLFAKILLTPVGIWPRLSRFIFSTEYGFAIYVSFIFGLICFLLIPHFIHTFNYSGDLGLLMKIMAAQVFSSVGVLKFWLFIANKADIRQCVDEIEGHYRNVRNREDLSVMKTNAKLGRFFVTTYLIVSYGGALPYHVVMPIMAERIVLADNSTRLPLSYPSEYVFFDVFDWSLSSYTVLFVEQMITSNIIVATNCGCFCFIAACVMHACCLFEVVCNRVELILQDGIHIGIEELVKRVQNIVQLHNQALEYATVMQKALSTMMLWEMGGYTIIICFLEFGALQDLRDKNALGLMTYVTLMMSAFVNVFIISFIGDRLKEQSLKIGDLAYSMEWYELPKNIVSDLILIIMRSNQPTKVAAGKVFFLSLQGFCDVCKTSMAYFNCLRATV